MPLNALCEELFVEAVKTQTIVVLLRRLKGEILNSIVTVLSNSPAGNNFLLLKKVSEVLLACLNSSNVDCSALPASEIAPLI